MSAGTVTASEFGPGLPGEGAGVWPACGLGPIGRRDFIVPLRTLFPSTLTSLTAGRCISPAFTLQSCALYNHHYPPSHQLH
jgi:hypothetical protein